MIRQPMLTKTREEHSGYQVEQMMKRNYKGEYRWGLPVWKHLPILVLALLVSQIEACMTTPLKGAELCQLCFQSDNSFKSCNILNPTKQYSETYCRTACCGRQYETPVPSSCLLTSSTQPPTSGTSSGQTPSVATILIIVFFSIPVVICLIAMIHSCIQQRSRNQAAAARPNEDRPHSTINLADYNMDESYPYHVDTKQSCSICLEDHCNVITFCGHPYHSQCLAAWISKKQKCPLCVSRNYNPLTFYCVQCFRAVRMSLLYKRMKEEDRQTWIENVNLKCEACLNQVKAEQIEFSINDEDIEKYQDWKKPPVQSQIGVSDIKMTPVTQSHSRIIEK